MENRRIFPRFESTFQIRYFIEGKSTPTGYTISTDVSRGGLRMPSSSGIVNKGDVVKLDIGSAGDKRRIAATGKVKWLKNIDRDAPLDEEVGIEFIDIKPADINKLLEAWHAAS